MSNYYDTQLINELIGPSVNPYYSSSALDTAGVWTIIAAILAIIGGILTYCLFVKAKDEPKNKTLKWLKDFLAFRIMWIEPLLKIVYYIVTIFIVLFSFSFLALGGGGVIMWITTLVLGPIVARVAYEGAMMFIMVWRNTREIAENTKKK